MAKASVLSTRERAKYKIQAQQLFEEVLEQTFDYEVELFIKVRLCDLLLDELKYSGTKDILYEIQIRTHYLSISGHFFCYFLILIDWKFLL